MSSEGIYSDSDYSGDSYESSFIDDSQLKDDAHYFDDQGNIGHFRESYVLEADEDLQNIKYNLRQARFKK